MNFRRGVFSERLLFGRRSGSVALLAILAIIMVGTLGTAFHFFSRQAQAQAFRFTQAEAVRLLAESAIDEGFMYLFRKTQVSEPWADGEHQKAVQFFIDRPAAAFPVPVALLEKEAPSCVRGDFEPVVEVQARHIDFRDSYRRNQSDPFPYRFTDREGVGTVELRASARLIHRNQADRKAFVECTVVRHHDFKVAALVTERDNNVPRKAYAGGAVLDYALLVRNGLEEFRRRKGSSLNHRGMNLVFDQDGIDPGRFGKIFFGGTQDPMDKSPSGGTEPSLEKRVFLNIPCGPSQSIIPAISPVEQVVVDEVSLLEELLGALDPSLKGVKGVFSVSNEPFEKTPEKYQGTALAEVEETVFKGTLAATGDSAENNVEPGIGLVSPKNLVDAKRTAEILEGAIRQRFFTFARFSLDFAAVSGFNDKAVRELRDKYFPCVTMPKEQPADSRLRTFLAGLPSVKSKKVLPMKPSIISTFQDAYLYQSGQQGLLIPSGACFSKPAFFNIQNQAIDVTSTAKPLGFEPWRHIPLYHRRFKHRDQLVRYGVFDPKNGILNLRGIIMVQPPSDAPDEDGVIDLFTDSGQPLVIRGQGLLVTSRNISIRCGIKKEVAGRDLGVLWAKGGNITVDTDQPVEATLVSINGNLNGQVLPRKGFQLLGGLIVDEIGLPNWPVGQNHVVRYDPDLKRPQGKGNLYTISLLRPITFQRITENDLIQKP